MGSPNNPAQDTLILAMAQMRVIGGDLRGNLLRAATMTAEAAAGGADVIVLPEAMDAGWTHHTAPELAEPVPGGATLEYLAGLAEDHAICVCAGLTEREGDRIYNTAVFIGRTGKLVHKHRKVNELKFARNIYSPGGGGAEFSTEFGKIAMMICADAFWPGQVISRTLAANGARMILSPCAWAVPPDHDNDAEPYGQLWIDSYAPVAKKYGIWIAGVSNVGKLRSGEWAGHHCIGSSMLVGPDGEIVTRAPYGRDAESLTLAEIPRH